MYAQGRRSVPHPIQLCPTEGMVPSRTTGAYILEREEKCFDPGTQVGIAAGRDRGWSRHQCKTCRTFNAVHDLQCSPRERRDSPVRPCFHHVRRTKESRGALPCLALSCLALSCLSLSYLALSCLCIPSFSPSHTTRRYTHTKYQLRWPLTL